MRHLRGDGPPRLARWVLDVETDGLGTIDGGPPEQFLCVLYRAGDLQQFWGHAAAQDALGFLLDAGKDVEVWAHFGGMFDHRLTLPWLVGEMEATGSIVNVGSLMLCADLKVRGVRLRLCDSIRLLPGSLADIGESLGLPKLEHDHAETRTMMQSREGRDKLLEYCTRDCEILWRALDEMEIHAAEMGVAMRTTLASTSSASVRKSMGEEGAPRWDDEVEAMDQRAESCNYGGRVEVFNRVLETGYVYDFHSAYPAAMLEPLPWDYLESGRKLRDSDVGWVEATVDVGPVYLPILPWRAREGVEKGRLYFPKGRWRGAFTTEELRAAVEWGGADIVKVHAVHRYATSTVMRDFALMCWEKRKSATGFARYKWKITMNSCYGKLVEGRLKDLFVLNPENEEGLEPLWEDAPIYRRETQYTPAFRNVIAGATITARARIALHEALLFACKAGFGPAIAYCDTDSIVTSAPPDQMAPLMGDGLGRLALEHRIDHGRFAAPKFYFYQDADTGEWITHAKGFGRDLSHWELWHAMNGEPVHIERTAGLKEVFARQSMGYERISTTKQHRFGRPKRAEGGCRPWSIEELTIPYHPDPLDAFMPL